MRTAVVDPELSVRVTNVRELRYTVGAAAHDDRPPHVRAASGLAFHGGRLVVVQDDTAFLATVAGGEVAAIPLPRGAGGRRRFEVALGNKHEKLDLEACVTVADELWAFGSGSTAARERIAVIADRVRIVDAAPLYRGLHELLGGSINLEGAAAVGEELWLFHRGNTGPADPGPAIARIDRGACARWLHGIGPLPAIAGATWFELGEIAGVRLGFTDAIGVDARALYLAAAEDSPDAIEDGCILGSQLGVIDDRSVRATRLEHDGAPLKAEGLALDPRDQRRAYVVTDPDDVERPARLYELELVGPWPV
jgi:hypothetical protein